MRIIKLHLIPERMIPPSVFSCNNLLRSQYEWELFFQISVDSITSYIKKYMKEAVEILLSEKLMKQVISRKLLEVIICTHTKIKYIFIVIHSQIKFLPIIFMWHRDEIMKYWLKLHTKGILFLFYRILMGNNILFTWIFDILNFFNIKLLYKKKLI